MAYRKRTYRKRSRTYRRRRAYKKYPRATMYRSPKGILSTKRTYLLSMSPSSYPANQMIAPSLASVPSSAEFTELFHQWRVTRCKITWMPQDDVGTTDRGEATVMMYVTTKSRRGLIVDYDTENEFLEDPSFTCFKSNRKRTFYYVPNILGEAYESTTTTGYMPAYKRWLTTNDPSTPHYGFQAYFTPYGTAPAGGTFLGRFMITLYLQFKGVH